MTVNGYYGNWGDEINIFSLVNSQVQTDGHSVKTGTPIFSVYYDDDSPSVSISGTNLVLIHDGSSVNIELSGKTTSQVVAAINRSSFPYHATLMFEVEDVYAADVFTTSSDLTIDNGQIIRIAGHIVKPLEETQIRIIPPYNDTRYDPWYIVVNNGWVTIRWNGGDWVFTLPEYSKQSWSPVYGKGYIDLEDIPTEKVGPRAISVPRTPIHWEKNNLTIRVRDQIQSSSSIRDVDVNNGIIYLNTDFDDNETIFVNYTYKEDGYIYDQADLNPTEFHNPGVLDRYVVFYLLPYIGPDGILRQSCVRHSESSSLSGAVYSIKYTEEPILLLGAAQIRQVHDITEVQVTDTRVRGGGVKRDRLEEAKKKNREILSSADYGFFDGRPYPGNMALFVTLPEEVKNTLSKEEIKDIVHRFTAYGTYTILEFD